jgi:hypothetical protein
MPSGGLFLGGGALLDQGMGLRLRRVDLVKRQLMTERACELDEASGDLGRDRLVAVLVVPDVPLGDADAFCYAGLSEPEALADCAEGVEGLVHVDILAPLVPSCNSAAICVADFPAPTIGRVKEATERRPKQSKVTAEHEEEARKLLVIWKREQPRLATLGYGTQESFGLEFKIGNQAAVGFFLNGKTPLSPKAAVAFARGLGCKVADFSPRLAELLNQNSTAEKALTPELMLATSFAKLPDVFEDGGSKEEFYLQLLGCIQSRPAAGGPPKIVWPQQSEATAAPAPSPRRKLGTVLDRS